MLIDFAKMAKLHNLFNQFLVRFGKGDMSNHNGISGQMTTWGEKIYVAYGWQTDEWVFLFRANLWETLNCTFTTKLWMHVCIAMHLN